MLDVQVLRAHMRSTGMNTISVVTTPDRPPRQLQLRKVNSTVYLTGEQRDQTKDALRRLLEAPSNQVECCESDGVR